MAHPLESLPANLRAGQGGRQATSRLTCEHGLRSARLDDALGANLLRELDHDRLQLLELEAGDGSAEELVHIYCRCGGRDCS